jgi:hypothetical protein
MNCSKCGSADIEIVDNANFTIEVSGKVLEVSNLSGSVCMSCHDVNETSGTFKGNIPDSDLDHLIDLLSRK